MIKGTNHAADRAAGHVSDQAPEETLLGQVRVVLLQVLHGSLEDRISVKIQQIKLCQIYEKS